MRWITKYRKQRLGALAAAIAVTAWMPTAMADPAKDALPDVKEIVSGIKDEIPKAEKITADSNGIKHMNITLSDTRAAVNWNSFNIGSKAEVNFKGPAGGWMVLNRVAEGNPSKIYGKLSGQGGTVFLINPSGITFGGTAQVDVGSLVASTLNIEDSDFEKGTYEFKPLVGKDNKEITGSVIKNLAVLNNKNTKAINATDNVVLIAHQIENKGNINGKQVSLVAGDNVTLSSIDNVSGAELEYDTKIGVVVKKLSAGGQIINSGTINATDGYVVMKAKDAQNVLQNVINDEDITAANRIYKDKDGNMVLLGDVNLAGDKVQVTDKAKTHVESADQKAAGTLNILSTNVIIDEVKDTSANKAKISASSLNDTLSDTNVNIVASPLEENYYSDITINQNINKGENNNDSVKDTELSLTAGRNISVDAAITSKAGKLNVKLNGDNSKDTKSTRSDGAVIIRSNIATNGGDFVTTGDNGTYIGLSNEELTNLIYKEGEQNPRTISTDGGNISFGGKEVLLATGNTVVLNTEKKLDENTIKRGMVFVEGTINSANAYSLRINRASNGNEAATSWANANEAAKEYWKKDGKVIEGTKSYLAVITGALEDAVVSATIPPDTSNKSEAFVGGHVVAVKANENGVVELDENGNPQVLDKDGNVYNPDSDKDILIIGQSKRSNNIANGGWYKDANGKPVRYWAWVDGNEKEKGTIFYIQTKGENVEKNYENDPSHNDQWMEMSHGEKVIDTDGNEIYSNFAPGEPNDDKGEGGEGSQTALSVNYTSYDTTTAKNKFYAKWDDVCSNHDKYKFGVVETELSPSSLKIIAGDVTLGGAVGNLSKLDNMTINSTGKVDMNGSVQLYKALDVKAQNDITAAKFIDVGSINASGKIKLSAGKDVSIGGKITSHKVVSQQAEQPMVFMTSLRSSSAVPNEKDDIIISAQGSFNNNVAEEDSANALTTDPGRYWKVYADDPANSNMGKLNSNSFALWSWNGTEQVSDEGNMYIFKATPKLTYTAFDKTKRYGETLTDMGYGNSYAVKNSLSGQYTQNFKDGIDAKFMARKTLEGAVTDGVTTSAGYPSTAYVGIYDIDVKGSNVAKAWGYDIVDKTAKLTVTGNNPEDVKPQLDPHDTTNVDGSASYTTAPQQTGPGADRVLGLQSAELPFFREENGQTKLYGTYDVSVDPDKVKMEPTAKVLPEPDQPKNQYREYDKEITTKVGTAKFKLTYNGSTFDIYPVDIFGKKVLKAGDAAKNVEVESQALFAAFKEMGITLDDLDGVYTHFDNKEEVRPFRK